MEGDMTPNDRSFYQRLFKQLSKELRENSWAISMAALAETRRIIAETQTTAPTKADPSDAQVLASTAEPTPQSSPSDRTITDDGPAALCSTSVNGHQWVVPWAKDNGVIHEPRGWCQKCGALLLFDRIVVPDARQVWSILVKQASPSFAANSSAASAPSASSSFRETVKEQLRLGMRPMHEDCETCEEMRRQLAVPEYSHIPEQRVRPEEAGA